jgi:hypothetical protein
MTAMPNERKPLTLLSAMIVAGLGLLSVPWFLTPPAYLDLAVRDSVFDADLSARHLTVTDDGTGRAMSVPIRRIGNLFIAHIGRINSGNGSYTARLEGYHPLGARVQAAALQNVRVPVELKPTFGRLEIATFNAIHAAEPVDAIVKDGARTLSSSPRRVVTVDLPPGRHRFSAQAPGYCPSEREFEVRAGKITRAALPLSPDLKDDEASSSAGGTIHAISTHISGSRTRPASRRLTRSISGTRTACCPTAGSLPGSTSTKSTRAVMKRSPCAMTRRGSSAISFTCIRGAGRSPTRVRRCRSTHAGAKCGRSILRPTAHTGSGT